MAANKRIAVDRTIARLTSLKAALDAERREIVDDAATLLSELETELARLAEQVRRHAGEPYRKKPEQVPSGQLAFDLLKMLSSRLGDGGPDKAPETGEGGEPDKPDEADKPERKRRKRRGRDL